MQFEEFEQYARAGASRIPVFRQVLADLDTPLSVYMKLADLPYTFLLESVEGGERWGRYSIIGLPAREVIRVRGDELIREIDGIEVERRQVTDPLAEIADLSRDYEVPEVEGLPRFSGGLVGYFGYDTVQGIEPRLQGQGGPDQLGLDDIVLMVAEEVVVFDSLSGRLFLIVNADTAHPHAWQKAQRRLDRLAYRLRMSTPAYPANTNGAAVDEDDFVSGFSRDDFQNAVQRVRDYIQAGDAMQVVLSQRLSVDFKARSIDVYRALRSLNPSPYMFFLDLGETQVVGSSPEVLVRVEAGEVMLRPIAGTRPRGQSPEHDHLLETELLSDPKELAEHLMLIDLGRNDVGRVAETGSVRLTDEMVIERYSHVMHIVSEVRGKLSAGLTAFDALRAAFPAGTVSGAPKVRAMEIIAELEPTRRGVYAGAVGYIDWRGNMDTAIAIRTAVVSDGKLHVQAGAGIVADSDPLREWEETMSKGRALFRAVRQASGGL